MRLKLLDSTCYMMALILVQSTEAATLELVTMNFCQSSDGKIEQLVNSRLKKLALAFVLFFR